MDIEEKEILLQIADVCKTFNKTELIKVLQIVCEYKDQIAKEKSFKSLDSIKETIINDIAEKLEKRKELVKDEKVLANWNIKETKFDDGSQWLKFVYTDGINESLEERVILKKDLTKIGFAFPYDPEMVRFFNGKDKKGRQTEKRLGFWNKPYWVCDVDKIIDVKEHEFFNGVKYQKLWLYIEELIRVKSNVQSQTIPKSVNDLLL